MISGKTDLTLKGSGADVTIIQAGHSTNAIRIQDGSTGEITDFTIRGGGHWNHNEGGGIQLIGGQFTVAGCILIGNEAVNSGAISVEQGASMEILNSLIVSNKAWNAAGALLVRLDSEAVLINNIIANNRANYSTGGISNGGNAIVTNNIVWANELSQRQDRLPPRKFLRG